MKIGKVSESVLKRSVLKQIKTKRSEILSGAAVGADCAIFSPENKLCFASCVQEAAVALEADIEVDANPLPSSLLDETPKVPIRQLIIKCANNLAVGGATPISAMITLLLPVNIEEAVIRKLMSEAEEACKQLSMEISGGQTTVTEAVTVPFAVVTGIGFVEEECICNTGQGKAGQDIVISKWIGLEGTALLAKKQKHKLVERFPTYFVEEAMSFDRLLSVVPEAATAVKSGVCAMHDASKGGIFGALWELAEGAGTGLTVDLKKLPLRQETVEICEFCNVNPYELLSGGSLLMTTLDGEALVEELEKQGINAVVVGRLTDSKDRILTNDDEIRYMDKPKTDEIYRVL